MSRTARVAAWAHLILNGTAHRLATGHSALVGAVAARPVWPTNSAAPAARKKPDAVEPETAEPTADEKPTPAKKGAKKAPKEATDEDSGKKKEEPPAHTTYWRGPRRAVAAAAHWANAGEGPWDFFLRAGLLLVALGILAYVVEPYATALHPVALGTTAAIVVVYEFSPRLSVILAVGLVVALVDPAWLCITLVALLAIELAPALAALLVVGLAAAAIYPALMWPLTLFWVAAAWRAGAPQEETVEQLREEDVEEELPAPLPEDSRTTLLRWLERLTRGTSGIHLDQLHATLTAHPDLAALTRPQMRVWLTTHGIPIERTLRVGMIPGRSGIARHTIETLLSATSQPLPSPVESEVESAPLHASDLQESPHSPGVESGLESSVEYPQTPPPAPAGVLAGSPEITSATADALYT